MANEQIKQDIILNIKENNNNEITGEILQSVLLAMVDALGEGAQMMGEAVQTTVPATGDSNMFYLAVHAGTYPSFNVTTEHPSLLTNQGGTWHALSLTDLPIWNGAEAGSVIVGSRTNSATDEQAYAEGYDTSASAPQAHAEGNGSNATGDVSHAEGNGTAAHGVAAHSEGDATTASGDYSHAEGNGTTASGQAAHAEGEGTQALKKGAHAEGQSTTANGGGAHAEGVGSEATAKGAHAEGTDTEARAEDAHAEGYAAVATGNVSHAEGSNSAANGAVSHAEGYDVAADGDYSHAEGEGTRTTNEAEHAEGKFNKSNTGTRHSVGIGTSNNDRKNAVEVMDNGDVYVDGVGGYDGTNAGASGVLTLQDEMAHSYGFIFDVTKENSGTTFASLEALLSDENLDTLIPTSVRTGGMTIRFVLTSDNKYVQFRYMSKSTTSANFTNVANWQGVVSEIIAESDNLATSGSIAEVISIINLKGNGDTIVSGAKISVKENSPYYLLVKNPNVSMNGVDTTANVYRLSVIAYDSQDSIIERIIAVPVSTSRLEEGYTFTTPINTEYIRVYSRSEQNSILTLWLQNITYLDTYKEANVVVDSKNPIESNAVARQIGGMLRWSEQGWFIITNGEVGTTVSLTPIHSNLQVKHAIVPVSAGDQVIITGASGDSGRLWAFVDSNNILLSHADANISLSDFKLIAPQNAALLIINDITNYTSRFVGKTVEKITEDVSYLKRKVGDCLPKSEGYLYIKTNVEVGQKVNITPLSTPVNYRYTIIRTKEGESFILNGKGGDEPRLWAFTTDSFTLISKSESAAEAENLELVAPTNSSFLIINDKENKYSYYNGLQPAVDILYGRLDEIYKKIDFIDNIVYDVHGNVGDIASLAVIQNNNYKSIIIPCERGDMFIVNAKAGGDTAKVFTFLDSNNVILEPYALNVTEFHGVVTAPQGAKSIVIETKDKDLQSYSTKNQLLADTRAIALKCEQKEIDYSYIEHFANNGIFGSFSLCFLSDNSSIPMIVSIKAKYEGENKPTISFSSGIYTSGSYIVGKKDNFCLKEWRIPPVIAGTYYTVNITVPQNCTLYITDFSIGKDRSTNKKYTGVQLNSHLGFQSVAPENTMMAYELAAKCGFPACVVNPISNADGTIYCYHEDDEVLSLNGGSAIALSATQFASLTDEDIQNYRVIGFGNMRNYYNEKIPTFDEFLYLCSVTGMLPILGTHPAPTDSQWETIRMSLLKYGLLDKVVIKAFSINVLEKAYSILGGTVKGFVYDVGNVDYETACETMDNSTLSQFNGEKGIEYLRSLITEDVIRNTLLNGYKVSVWEVGKINGDRYEELINWGVTGFTEDYNCCNGLNF